MCTHSTMTFEWDEAKNRKNIEKHGLSFQRAKTIFDGIYLYDEDLRFDYGEKRYVAIGLLEAETSSMIVVVFTKREDTIRIISARAASKTERRRYFETIR